MDQNFRIGGFDEPVHPDFRLRAIPVYLPAVATQAETVASLEQAQPTLDRTRVQFVVTVGVTGEPTVSEPVDHTDAEKMNEFIVDSAQRLSIDAQHLRIAIPHAVQNCLALVEAQQRLRPARLDVFDVAPERIEASTRNLETIAAWCLMQLRRTDLSNDWYRLVKLGDSWYKYFEHQGFQVMTKGELETEMLILINRAAMNTKEDFRREILRYLAASLSAPKHLALGQWMPRMVFPSATENTWLEQYWEDKRNHPADEMLMTAEGLIHLPTVDLGSPDYIPISPRWFGAVTTKVSIDPFAQCLGWHRHLDRVFGTDAQGLQDRDALQDWFGYCLMPHARLNKFCILHGASQSGKSTCLRVLMAVVNSVTITLGELDQQFGLERLEGVTHAAIDDAKVNNRGFQPTANSRFLSITGGMTTTIQRKNQTSTDTHPGLKFTMTANEMPRFDNTHNAIANRIHPIHFPRAIAQNDRRPGIELGWIKDELSGILSWAIDGYKRVYDNERLSSPGSMDVSMAELNDETDPISEFVRESLTQSSDPNASVTLRDVFEAYRGYFLNVNVNALTRREIKQLLVTRYGYNVSRPSNHHVSQAERLLGTSLTGEGESSAFAYRASL